MIIKILQPLSLLLSLSLILAFIYNYFEQNRIPGKIVSGIAYGALAVIAMMTPYDFFPGFIFDSRSVIISVSGLFGGPVTAIPAIVIGASYRLYLGGAGAIAGALVVLIAGSAGIVSFYIRNKFDIKIQIWNLLAFGFFTHFFSILGLAILPPDVMWKVVKNLSIPFFCIYPFLTVFLGLIVSHIELHFTAEADLKRSQEMYEKLYNELKKSEERFRKLIVKSPLPMVITDSSQNILHLNDKLSQSFGYTIDDISTVAEWWCAVIPEDEKRSCVLDSLSMASAKATREKNDIEMQEMDLYTKAGDKRSCEFYMVPLEEASLYVLRDTTERKLMEETLIQTQKFESIGTLAGGIAHDFNNILAPVIGFAEMSLEDLPEDHPVHENLIDILNGAKRASDLVQQILSYSKQQDNEQSIFCFQDLILETLRLLRATLPSNIEINADLDDEKIHIAANATELHEVLMNLCTNAFHSMEANASGMLSIRLVRPKAQEDNGLVSGHYCCIEISDTGSGIPPEILDKVFDPYFTTKQQGKGTGLGLSVSRGIVESYNGTLRIESTPGQGTTITILLPIAAGVENGEEYTETLTDLRGNERVLLVDDEISIVKLGIRLLEKSGYSVTGLTSSTEALELFRSAPDNFDLIMTDMAMPGMVGSELAQSAMEIRPDIKVILCTGYSDSIDKEKAEAMGIKGYINKPISQKQVLLKIRELLDATSQH